MFEAFRPHFSLALSRGEAAGTVIANGGSVACVPLPWSCHAHKVLLPCPSQKCREHLWQCVSGTG